MKKNDEMPIFIKELVVKGKLAPSGEEHKISEEQLKPLLQRMEQRILEQCLEQLRDDRKREQQFWQLNGWKDD